MNSGAQYTKRWCRQDTIERILPAHSLTMRATLPTAGVDVQLHAIISKKKKNPGNEKLNASVSGHLDKKEVEISVPL